MHAEMQTGTLTTRTQVGVQDLQQMIGLLAVLSTRMAEARAETMAGEMNRQMPTNRVSQGEGPPRTIKNSPAYWMDRGGLLSAYGNYKAAARCYQKAIDLAPDRAEAYFQLGVAYGEMGRFEGSGQGDFPGHRSGSCQWGLFFTGGGGSISWAGEEDQAHERFHGRRFSGG